MLVWLVNVVDRASCFVEVAEGDQPFERACLLATNLGCHPGGELIPAPPVPSDLEVRIPKEDRDRKLGEKETARYSAMFVGLIAGEDPGYVDVLLGSEGPIRPTSRFLSRVGVAQKNKGGEWQILLGIQLVGEEPDYYLGDVEWATELRDRLTHYICEAQKRNGEAHPTVVENS